MEISRIVLEACCKCNQSYLNKVTCRNGYKLLITKHTFIKSFEIDVLDGDKVINSYSGLSPFDTYDMIRELKANYDKKVDN